MEYVLNPNIFQEKLWCTDIICLHVVNPFAEYWGWVTGVGMRILPVFGIALLNVLLLYGLRRKVFTRNSSSRGSSKEKQLTVGVILLNMSFLFGHTPSALFNPAFRKYLLYSEEAHFQARVVSNLFENLNMSFSVLIYLLCDRGFRRMLKIFVCGKGVRSQLDSGVSTFQYSCWYFARTFRNSVSLFTVNKVILKDKHQFIIRIYILQAF